MGILNIENTPGFLRTERELIRHSCAFAEIHLKQVLTRG